MLQRVLALKNIVLTGEGQRFGDKENVADYAKDAVKQMSSISVISGFDDGNFGPKMYATRAETAVIVSRVLGYLGGVHE